MKALVLSGGGSKGAYQLGVLKKWMGEDNKDYKIMTGVSVGALNVAGLSQQPYGNPKEAIDWLIQLWLDKVETKNIYQRWFPLGALHSLWEKSIYDTTPLRKLVESSFDHEKAKACGRDIAVGAVSLDTGENRFATQNDPHFIDWVLASSSYPVFFAPIKIDGQLWSDGGVKNVTPLGQAIKMGATEIDVIITSNIWSTGKWDSSSKRAVPDQIIRTLNLMGDQIMRDDIKLTGLKNDLSDLSDKYKHVTVRVVHPEHSLGVDSLAFNRDEVKVMIEKGYNDADKLVEYV